MGLNEASVGELGEVAESPFLLPLPPFFLLLRQTLSEATKTPSSTCDGPCLTETGVCTGREVSMAPVIMGPAFK